MVLILTACQTRKLVHTETGQVLVEKSYMKTRIEGESYFVSFLKTVPYIRKYIHKRPGTSQEIAEFFKQQSAICEELRKDDPVKTNLSLAFLGDMMWIKKGWDKYLDPEVLQLCENQDLLFGNLETPVDPTRRVSFPIPDYPSFNSPVEFLTSFYSPNKHKNTLTALSIANNHAFDRGEKGAIETMKVLDSLGICYSGIVGYPVKQKPYVVIEKKGIRIGFYATCWGTNTGNGESLPGVPVKDGLRVNTVPGLAPLIPDKIDLSDIQHVLLQMKNDDVDFKIISIHWGFEFEYYPDPVIMETGRKIVASGADLIIGSHPHVQQPNEICFLNGYRSDLSSFQLQTADKIQRKALIAYSLGNFSTPMFTKAHRTGQIQSIRLYRHPRSGRIDFTVPDKYEVYNQSSKNPEIFRKVVLNAP